MIIIMGEGRQQRLWCHCGGGGCLSVTRRWSGANRSSSDPPPGVVASEKTECYHWCSEIVITPSVLYACVFFVCLLAGYRLLFNPFSQTLLYCDTLPLHEGSIVKTFFLFCKTIYVQVRFVDAYRLNSYLITFHRVSEDIGISFPETLSVYFPLSGARPGCVTLHSIDVFASDMCMFSFSKQ